MSVKGIAVIAAIGLLTVPALAGAASQLTATNVRFADHGAYVRVVVDFNGNVFNREIVAGSVTKTMATIRLNRSGATTSTSGGTGAGVGASVQPATQGLSIAMKFARLRFKYLSYITPDNRLVIDLWKSAPPTKPLATCTGFVLTSRSVAPAGVVNVSGSEHGVFENQFQVLVRGANGAVLGRKANVFGPGKWTVHVPYRASMAQKGTVEAVALSPKDGALECLTQAPVMLAAN
jgi:hypothetical protein